MTLPKIIRYNPSTFTALLFAIAIASGIFGCHLLQNGLPETLAAAGDIAETIAPLAPPPYKEILLVISGLLSSGIFIDNRRKDSIIKVLKPANAKNKHSSADN